MKIASYIIAPLLLLFTYWQINDATQYNNHDNWFWIIYYAAAAAITFLNVVRPLPFSFFCGAIGFSLGACLFRLQDAVGNFDFAGIFRATAVPAQMNATTQQPNEAGGLLLVAVWLGVLAWNATRKTPS
jgi:hypothetical protein